MTLQDHGLVGFSHIGPWSSIPGTTVLHISIRKHEFWAFEAVRLKIRTLLRLNMAKNINFFKLLAILVKTENISTIIFSRSFAAISKCKTVEFVLKSVNKIFNYIFN